MAPLTTAGDAPPDDSIAWHLWVGVTVTAVPATLAVALRFYARIKGRIPLKVDDWLIVGAVLSVWAMAGFRFSQVIYFELGRHTYYVAEWKVREFYKSFIATQVAYFLSATFTRSSILFFYRRLFILPAFLVLVWIAMALVVGFFVSCTFAAIFGCQPVSYFWNQDQPGQCMDEVLFFRVNGILNLILDLIVLVLPIPMLWRLQMHIKKKIALSLIFSLGLFACLCSSFRLVQFQDPKWKDQSDPMRAFVHAGVWSSIEQSVGVVCACLPCLRLLLKPSAGWDQETDRLTSMRPEHADRSQQPRQPLPEHARWQPDAAKDDGCSEVESSVAVSMSNSYAASATNTTDSDAIEKDDVELHEKRDV